MLLIRNLPCSLLTNRLKTKPHIPVPGPFKVMPNTMAYEFLTLPWTCTCIFIATLVPTKATEWSFWENKHKTFVNIEVFPNSQCYSCDSPSLPVGIVLGVQVEVITFSTSLLFQVSAIRIWRAFLVLPSTAQQEALVCDRCWGNDGSILLSLFLIAHEWHYSACVTSKNPTKQREGSCNVYTYWWRMNSKVAGKYSWQLFSWW